jgi:hypothetical protein
MTRKKKYYLPGLISLVCLPIIFLFFLPQDKPQPVLIRFFLPKDEPDYRELSISKYKVWAYVKKKKQVTIQCEFKDNSQLAEYRKAAKFDYIRRQIEHLSFSNDTNSVLKIELSDGSSYGDFVQILNDILIYDVKRYALTDNTLYVFANEPPANEVDLSVMYCGTGLIQDSSPEELISLVNLSGRKILFLTGFILLIVIPGLLRVKKYYFKGMPVFTDNTDI